MGVIVGDIEGDTRSLDYSSCDDLLEKTSSKPSTAARRAGSNAPRKGWGFRVRGCGTGGRCVLNLNGEGRRIFVGYPKYK